MRPIKILMTIFLCLSLLSVFGQKKQDGFVVDILLTGFKDSTKFYFINLDSTQSIDSAFLKNKKLRFSGYVSEPVVYRLLPEQDRISFNFWVENKKFKLAGDKTTFSGLTVKGSPLNSISRSVEGEHLMLDKQRDSIFKKVMTENDKTRRSAMLKEISDIDKTVTKIRLQTIAVYQPSLVTIKELYYLRNDLTTDSLKVLFDKFPDRLKQTKYGDIIGQYILTDNLKIGSAAPAITGKNSAGKEIQLSDYKGKCVLLDFWASWCGPCRSSNKELAELAGKFKNTGFEIISFSIDTDPKDWQTASKKDGISWANISDLKGLYSRQAASYRIRAIPRSFLIDKNGIIVDIFGGYDDSKDGKDMLENKIKELLK